MIVVGLILLLLFLIWSSVSAGKRATQRLAHTTEVERLRRAAERLRQAGIAVDLAAKSPDAVTPLQLADAQSILAEEPETSISTTPFEAHQLKSEFGQKLNDEPTVQGASNPRPTPDRSASPVWPDGRILTHTEHFVISAAIKVGRNDTLKLPHHLRQIQGF